MVIHEMKLKEKYFNAIKAGLKTIEMRLYDDKRREISVGDIIEFTNMENKEKIRTQVLDLHIVNSFEELYNKFNKVSLGYEEHEIALYTDMEQFYLPTEMEKVWSCWNRN